MAIRGNRWKGERERLPEGIGMVTVSGDLLSWASCTNGWTAAG